MKHLEGAPSNYKWQVLVVVMIGTLMAALDTSIVNVSIPAIMADFGVGIDDIEWVMTGYMLAFATFMPLTNWFRDRVGHKNLYIASLIVFTIGSVLCGLAFNLPTLIGARVIQAIGGGALTPIGMAMISEVFEPRERGKAMGYWGVGVIMGPALGPTLGGILTKYLGWRWIFLVNLPIGIVGVLMSLRMLRRDQPHAPSKAPFDFWGFVFLSTFLIAFLLGVSNGEKEGWHSNYVVTCAVLSFFGMIGFLLVESLVPDGIVDLRLFKSSTMSIACLVTVARSIALFGGMFLIPLFLQQQMGFDEIESGLILLPGALVVALFMPFGGKVSDRFGARIPALVGLAAVEVFMIMYTRIDVNTSVWGMIEPTLIRGFGMALLMAPVTATAMNSVPIQKAGAASSMLNLIQQVSASIGIAFLATVLSHRIRFHMAVNADSLTFSTPALREVAGRLMAHVHSMGLSHVDSAIAAKALLARHVAQTSVVESFQDAFWAAAILVAVAIVPAVFLPGKPVAHAAKPGESNAFVGE